jgi:hypothetical protein
VTEPNLGTWTTLDAGAGILCVPYKFGGGIATTFVFRGAKDGLVVMSPGCGLDGRLFRPGVWLQVKDKKSLASWFDRQLSDTPPTTIVPAHGNPVQRPDLVAATRAQIARL